MKFDIKSKPMLMLFILVALILISVLSYIGSNKPALTEIPATKTEEGNPRVIVTEPEKYAKEMEEAAKNAAPTTPVIVTISDDSFAPAEVAIKAPSIVTFENAGETSHSVRGVSGKWGSLKDLEPGESYSQQFDVAGTYEYFDPLNPKLTGKVVVE